MSNTEQKLIEAIRTLGYNPPSQIPPGKIVRFATSEKPGDDAGWVWLFPDGRGAVFGDFRTDERHHWWAETDRTLTLAERAEFKRKADEAQRDADAVRERRAEKAAKLAVRLCHAAQPATSDHTYLRRKKVSPSEQLLVMDIEVFCDLACYRPKSKDFFLEGSLLLAPVVDVDGNVSTIELIDENGGKSALAGGRKKGNFWASQSLPKGNGRGLRIAIAEGVATALTAVQAGMDLAIAALSSGNLLSVTMTVRKRYPDAGIVVLADLGAVDKARVAARAAGAVLAIPDFGAAADHLSDFNDLADTSGLETVKAALTAAFASSMGKSCDPPLGSSKSELPAGYRWKDNGAIEYRVRGNGGETWHPLISPIEFVALARAADQSDWCVELRIMTVDGIWVNWTMPRGLLVGGGEEVLRQLLGRGASIPYEKAARTALLALLQRVQPTARVLKVDKVGWHDQSYVHPVGAFGPLASESFAVQAASSDLKSFDLSGNFDQWRDLAALAVGNSRLALAVSAAFAGPLLKPTGQESGGVHFRGRSSSGKTTALLLAGSVWGGGTRHGFVNSWRSTDNGLETLGPGRNDGLCCLDELSEAEPRDLLKSVYMLSNGVAKRRATRDATAKPLVTWRVIILSSGEVSFADKIAEGGGRATAGQEVRILDMAADAGAGHGVFEALHGFQSAASLAEHIRQQSLTHFGHASMRFLEALTLDLPRNRSRIEHWTTRWISLHIPREADGQVQRVANRFALIAAAGELAVEFGILPWSRGEASNAAARCFQDWFAERGGTAAAEIIRGIANVREFLERYGFSRFAHIEEKRPKVHNCAGYYSEDDSGSRTFLMFTSAFKEACGGIDPKLVAGALGDRGLLKRDSEGKNSISVRVPRGIRKRMYVVMPTLWNEDPD